MFDRKDENDTLRDVARETADRSDAKRKQTPGRIEDGSGLVPETVARREVRDRRAGEREADSGSLGTGIGDDRPPGSAPPHEGEPEP